MHYSVVSIVYIFLSLSSPEMCRSSRGIYIPRELRRISVWYYKAVLFFCVRAIRSAFLNFRRIQSQRCDFALTKTCDENGRPVTPICLQFCAAKTQKVCCQI